MEKKHSSSKAVPSGKAVPSDEIGVNVCCKYENNTDSAFCNRTTFDRLEITKTDNIAHSFILTTIKGRDIRVDLKYHAYKHAPNLGLKCYDNSGIEAFCKKYLKEFEIVKISKDGIDLTDDFPTLVNLDLKEFISNKLLSRMTDKTIEATGVFFIDKKVHDYKVLFKIKIERNIIIEIFTIYRTDIRHGLDYIITYGLNNAGFMEDILPGKKFDYHAEGFVENQLLDELAESREIIKKFKSKCSGIIDSLVENDNVTIDLLIVSGDLNKPLLITTRKGRTTKKYIATRVKPPECFGENDKNIWWFKAITLKTKKDLDDIYAILTSDNDVKKNDDIKELLRGSKRFLFVNNSSFFRSEDISDRHFFKLNGNPSIHEQIHNINTAPQPISLSEFRKMSPSTESTTEKHATSESSKGEKHFRDRSGVVRDRPGDVRVGLGEFTYKDESESYKGKSEKHVNVRDRSKSSERHRETYERKSEKKVASESSQNKKDERTKRNRDDENNNSNKRYRSRGGNAKRTKKLNFIRRTKKTKNGRN